MGGGEEGCESAVGLFYLLQERDGRDVFVTTIVIIGSRALR